MSDCSPGEDEQSFSAKLGFISTLFTWSFLDFLGNISVVGHRCSSVAMSGHI